MRLMPVMSYFDSYIDLFVLQLSELHSWLVSVIQRMIGQFAESLSQSLM